MRKTCRTYGLALGLGLLASAAALAAGREAALGSDGEVYTVRTGAYKDLFPGGKDSERDNVVVALDITKPGAALQRLLVPGTGGPETESSPSLLFEDDSETVYLLWESERNFHPLLKLAWFDGAAWSRPVEVTGNPFAPKTSPQFAITRDSYEEPAPGDSTAVRHRTILHLVWQEENAAGALETFYSPILINDGMNIGWNPIHSLDDYLEGRVAPASAAVQPSLARAPVVQSGRDERTVVIAYASPALARLVAIEIDILPEQLIRLADGARSHIVDLGREHFPQDLAGLAEKARSHIVDLGHHFRPEIVQAIADQAKGEILAGAGSVEALAEKARSHIVDLGAQLSGRGLRGINGADATAKIMRIDDPDQPRPADAPSAHLLQFRVVSNLTVPAAGPGAVRLFVSPTGEDVIVSWAQADKVVYRNRRDGGWSDPKELRFSDNLNLSKAYEILEQRVRNR